MIKNIQTLCIGVGDGACYALSLLKVAEMYLGCELDVLKCVNDAITNKVIKFNWGTPTDNEAMYVNNPAEFLKTLTGRKWTVRKEGAAYNRKDKEYVINSWGKSDAEGAPRHFTFAGDDTLYISPLRTNGKLISVRVCKLED